MKLTPAIAADYQARFRKMKILWTVRAAKMASDIKADAARSRYRIVEAATGVPWEVVGVIHSLEGSLSFRTHLHNGDPLSARTKHVPRNRPLRGEPPFEWEESAIDALGFDDLTAWRDWSLPGTLFKLEAFNGFGYRRASINIPSPYLWSGSDQAVPGKFVADGKFSPTAVSKQVGAAVLLRFLGFPKP